MKRKLALMLVACMMLSACGSNATASVPTSPSNSANQQTISIDDSEISKRILEVGESYDGLDDRSSNIVGSSKASSGSTGVVNDIESYIFNNTGYNVNLNGDNVDGAMMYNDAVGGYGAFDGGGSLNSVNGLSQGAVSQYTEDIVPADNSNYNTEDYNDIKESGLTAVQTQPFSTFGADVDTASYSSLRRRIYENDGHGITDNAIRVEELINYFDYNYATPENGEKFGISTSLTKCPWVEDTMLLKIGIKAEEIPADQGSNIVFLVDTSGSMFQNNKLPLAQKALKMLVDQLSDKDTISIVTYAGSEAVACEGIKCSDTDKLKEVIDGLEASGSTNGEGGINKAYEIAEKYFIKGGNNRVILATDGDFNVGVSSEAGLIELIEDKKESGVFLSCLGFGDGNYQDGKMESLADHGNGNYAFIDCSREAEKALKEEMMSTLYTVAKDVKFQVEFNPAKVKGYKLVGYENREMAAEDFADDTKDGGEVGSGQTVTVLYEIVPTDSSREVPVTESKYNNEQSSSLSDELLAVNIRYKEPDSDKSQLITYPVTQDMYTETMDDDTSWAAGVAQFGMIKRDSEYKGTSTYSEVYNRLKADPRVMENDLMAEFLYLVAKEDGTITKKASEN